MKNPLYLALAPADKPFVEPARTRSTYLLCRIGISNEGSRVRFERGGSLMTNHWSSNSPARFWLCQDEIPDSDWLMAIRRALPVLGLTPEPVDVDDLLALVLVTT